MDTMDTLVKPQVATDLDTLDKPQMATDLPKLARFLSSLPPLVAAVVWDVLNSQITAKTVALADKVTDEEWAKYEVVRIVGACNPKYFRAEEAQVLVWEMME
ncbi:MAG: hypothetical protein KJ939_07065 [Nanoarchaeota archaeon]|nr:hypothetical protein [Nanoarchaeota archaeon]